MNYLSKIFIGLNILLINNAMNAQITLENEYSFSVQAFDVDDGEYFYAGTDGNTVRIYDEDHNLYKTVNLSPDPGYDAQQLALLSRKLFNTDENLEFAVTYRKTDTSGTEYYAEILNENGNSIKRIDHGYWFNAYNTNNGSKLIAGLWMSSGSTIEQTNAVYSLPGTLTGGMIAPEPATERGFTAYPNPTDGILRIEPVDDRPIRIFNSAGKEIKTVENQNTINLQNLPKGLYILNRGDEKFKVIKQ